MEALQSANTPPQTGPGRDVATQDLWRRYTDNEQSVLEIARETVLQPFDVAGRLLRAYGDEYLKIAARRKTLRNEAARTREPTELPELWRRFAVEGLPFTAVAKRVQMKPDAVRKRLRQHPDYLAVLERRAEDLGRRRHERNLARHELELLRGYGTAS